MSEPPAFDPKTPSSARVCDCLLGGTNHNQADRKLAAELERICPGIGRITLSGREFLARAVTWAATQGITQFIDLGCGLPVAAEHRLMHSWPVRRRDADTHVSARAVDPDATVAYVDHDYEVTLLLPALLDFPAGDMVYRGLAVSQADLRDPEKILADPGLLEVIDPDEPVCVILGLVLHYMPAAWAREVAAGYVRAVAPGSCVVISTGRFEDARLFSQVQAAYTPAQLYNHTRAQVASFFSGLDVIRPGVKPAAGLRPGWGDAPDIASRAYVLGGIGVRT